jgi:hypothetical protein
MPKMPTNKQARSRSSVDIISEEEVFLTKVLQVAVDGVAKIGEGCM